MRQQWWIAFQYNYYIYFICKPIISITNLISRFTDYAYSDLDIQLLPQQIMKKKSISKSWISTTVCKSTKKTSQFYC